MIRETQSAQFSQNQDGCNMYVIKETMCPPLPPIIITMALFGHAMYSYIHIARINEPCTNECVTVMTIYDICIYIYIYICIYAIKSWLLLMLLHVSIVRFLTIQLKVFICFGVCIFILFRFGWPYG